MENHLNSVKHVSIFDNQILNFGTNKEAGLGSLLKARSHTLVLFTSCFLSCLSCVLLQKQFGFSSILASALVGLAGSFVPKATMYNFKEVRALIYTSSFAAMTSITHLDGVFQIVILSMLTGSVFMATKQLFQGIGGKMGTTAFISVLIFSVLGGAL